jgi:hypothetical protein
VIKLAPCLDAARDREAAAFDAEFFGQVERLRRRYSKPMADRILRCILEFAQSNSEEPLKRLPAPIRQKLLAAFHEVQPIQPASVLPFSA